MERFNEILNTYKIPLALSFVGLVLLIGGMFSSGIFHLNSASPVQSVSKKSSDYPSKSVVKQTLEIKVDIAGEVNKPGVHILPSDSRMEDVIKLAGGFTDKANKEFLAKSLNLSQKVVDGQKIYIPKSGEVAGVMTASLATTAQGITGKIGVNTATATELDKLPGVGAVTSQKIIEGRPYQDLSELISKKVVSRSVFEKIKDQISLE